MAGKANRESQLVSIDNVFNTLKKMFGLRTDIFVRKSLTF